MHIKSDKSADVHLYDVVMTINLPIKFVIITPIIPHFGQIPLYEEMFLLLSLSKDI